MAAAQAVNRAVPAAQAAVQTAQQTVDQAQKTVDQARQTATTMASNAVQTAQQAASQVPGSQVAWNAIPQGIKDAANNLLHGANLSPGKPSAVYFANGYYAFVYPGGMFGTGRQRIVVVDSLGPIARLQKLERGELLVGPAESSLNNSSR